MYKRYGSTHGWRKKRIIHRGKGAYLRCPVFTSVHFSLRNEGSSEYIRLCEGRESLSRNFQTFQDPWHQFHGIGRLVLHSIADPGSRIRCLFDPWIRDPGWIKSGSGSGIWNEQPGSYFLELRNHFLGLKYFNSLMRSGIRIPDGKIWICEPGSRIEKNWIWDLEKHPGSATLVSETLLATLALLHMQVELIPWKFLHSLEV
jgi:hypothetical protein